MQNSYIRLKNITQSTIDDYNGVIENHLIPELGSIPLARLNPLHLQEFYVKKQEEYSGRTVQNMHRILRKALDGAVKTQLIKQNPADLVDAPKAKKYKPKVYDEEQFLKLLKVAKGTKHEIPILLAGGLGMRRGEIFGLRWDNISFKYKRMVVEQQLIPTSQGLVFSTPKTESGARTIEIPEYIIEVLKQELKEQKKNKMLFGPEYKDYNLVCCKANGDLIHPSGYSRDFKKFLEDNHLEHIRFHDLRHFNATVMLKYDVDIKVASRRLGHSTTSITQDIYQHILTDMDHEAARKINDGLFGGLDLR